MYNILIEEKDKGRVINCQTIEEVVENYRQIYKQKKTEGKTIEWRGTGKYRDIPENLVVVTTGISVMYDGLELDFLLQHTVDCINTILKLHDGHDVQKQI